jgi:hypothetical protein
MIKIAGYPIDCATSERHDFDAEVTSYPIESGSVVADGVQHVPDEVQIEGVVSDTPLDDVIRARRAGGFAEAGAGACSTEALEKLIAIKLTGEPVVLETEIRTYPQMILKSLTVPRDAKTGRALRFTGKFVAVEIVHNERTRVRVASVGTPQNKVKIAGPAVEVIGKGPANVTTKSGKVAAWNSKKGRYEYADKSGAPGGNVVPTTDLSTFTVKGPNGQQTTFVDSPFVDNTDFVDSDPANSTYFDQQSDEWRNTDGTPVTQSQLDKKRDLKTRTAVDRSANREPWYFGGFPTSPKGF